ncbi:alpha/beta fold hydrolase [Leucobacter sp. USHLN153]|uniref:alpha/beta fold hydrolase n=1 Tax=Leucobacter sp. USHLN153 TaxID=3081268 RepID=UPI0030162CDF
MPYLRIGDSDLYEEIEGTGEPIVVLHGGFCSLESLAPIATTLAASHRIYAYERPGHGRSADTTGEYSYDGGVAEALQYLDAHGLADAHIVGYSDGAIIGLLLATAHPERVRSLVAISGNLDPTAFSGDPGADGPSIPPLPTDETGLEEGDVSPERLAFARLSPDGPEHADVVFDKCMRLWTTEPHIGAADLARATSPVLVLGGDRDSVPPGHSLKIASHLPNARLGIVPGTSHGLVNEKPELVVALILDFLTEIAPPRP